MTLDKYLLDNRMTTKEFSQIIGAPFHTVTKWRQRLRIPRREWVGTISRATNNQVGPQDWYGPQWWHKK